jgi:hypothetical protein
MAHVQVQLGASRVNEFNAQAKASSFNRPSLQFFNACPFKDALSSARTPVTPFFSLV